MTYFDVKHTEIGEVSYMSELLFRKSSYHYFEFLLFTLFYVMQGKCIAFFKNMILHETGAGIHLTMKFTW